MNTTKPQEKTELLPQLIKQSNTYKLFVPRRVEEKIRYLIRKFPSTEWSGVLFYTHIGSFENNDLEIHCEDIFPMDLGTSGWTEFTMNEDVTSYMAQNLELFGCNLGLIHSHHTMGAFFSGQDTKTLQTEGNDTNCFVSLIVDTAGTYKAAVTRKIQKKTQVTTTPLSSSYEFFGEGPVNCGIAAVKPTSQTIASTIIEYFMLEVQVEQVDNPLSYLDTRFEQIAQKKKTLPSVSSMQKTEAPLPYTKVEYTPLTNSDDEDFYKWMHSERKKSATAKEALLFDDATMEEMVDVSKWEPDPTIIHHIVLQLVTCSLIVNKDLDLLPWVTNFMEKKYAEIFTEMETFHRWADNFMDFILDFYDDCDAPSEVYDNWDIYQSKILNAIVSELEEYPTNVYLTYYINTLIAMI